MITRVLLVTQPTIGGTATHVLDLAKGLDANLFEVTVVSPRDRVFQNQLSQSDVHHLSLDFTREIIAVHDLRNLIELRNILKEGNYHVVHAHSSKAGFLARIASWLTKVPVVLYTPHGFAFYQFSGLSKTLYYWLERIAIPFCEGIICVSPSEKQAAIEDKVSKPERTYVIENGIGLPQFPSADVGKLRGEINATHEDAIIGMVSRLARPKQPEELIQAAWKIIREAQNERVRFVFIGDGPLEAEAKALVQQLGLEEFFHFLGYREDVLALLADLDVFVLATSSEGLPYTIMEAMASAKPVVGARVKGVVDLVNEGETGLTYREGSVRELASHLVTLIEDPALRSALGLKGRKRIEDEFTIGTMIEKTATLYRELMGKHPTSSHSG